VKDYKAFVGPVDRWDRQAALQFTVLVKLGLRGHHHLLDMGCGALRAGRLFIPYLDACCYFGIEPEEWLLCSGIRHGLGGTPKHSHLLELKEPTFITGRRDFPAQEFGVTFHYAMAQSIFTHASPAQVRQCLHNVAGVLAPGGTFAATYQQGTPDNKRSEWTYPGCVNYTPQFMAAAGHDAGLAYREELHEVLGLRSRWAMYTKEQR
jgi:hypothetical protein